MIRNILKNTLIYFSWVALVVSEFCSRKAKRLIAKDLGNHNNDGAMK